MKKFKANIVSTDGSVLNLTDKERFPAPELLAIEDIFDLKNLDDTFRKENFSHYDFVWFSGNSIATFVNTKTDNRFTFKVKQKKYTNLFFVNFCQK